MNSKLNEKVAIGYVCSGQTFREITLYQLENNCIDNENIYYLIITDNKEYFNQCTRKNLIVNELKDFYSEYPEVEINEKFIETDDPEEYYESILNQDLKFSFSVYRFHLIQAQRLGITNVSMLCVDTCFNFKEMLKYDSLESTFNNMFERKNSLYNAVAIYGTTQDHNFPLKLTWRILKEKFNYTTDSEIVMTPDAAARLFIFESEEQMMKLFNIWHEVICHLYKTKEIEYYSGSRVINDEFILGPIYNMVGITHFETGPFVADHRIMNVFWVEFGKVRFDQEYINQNNLQQSNQ